VVEYNYAATHTAPGHTAIFTGVPPARNGVGSNQVWTAARDPNLARVAVAELGLGDDDVPAMSSAPIPGSTSTT